LGSWPGTIRRALTGKMLLKTRAEISIPLRLGEAWQGTVRRNVIQKNGENGREGERLAPVKSEKRLRTASSKVKTMGGAVEKFKSRRKGARGRK